MESLLRVRALLLVAAVALAAPSLVAAVGDTENTVKTVADWRFGRLVLTETDDGDFFLYTSLKNRGKSSKEEVFLWVQAGTATGLGDAAVMIDELSETTAGRRAAVAEITFTLSDALAQAPEYRLFLAVGDVVTDLIPVVDGNALPKSRERKQFHK